MLSAEHRLAVRQLGSRIGWNYRQYTKIPPNPSPMAHPTVMKEGEGPRDRSLSVEEGCGIRKVNADTARGKHRRGMKPGKAGGRQPAKVWLHARWVSLVPALILIFF